MKNRRGKQMSKMSVSGVQNEASGCPKCRVGAAPSVPDGNIPEFPRLSGFPDYKKRRGKQCPKYFRNCGIIS
jgi:hypothetical protein